MMSARLFIRNDDVWTVDHQFRYFFDLAVGHGIPVVHAVIPGKMDQGLIRFLSKAKEKTPHLLDIVQHGWVHENHCPFVGVKYEFGTSRPLASQRRDIKQGLKKMRLAFGQYFTPAFVPPYHGFDEHTLRVLNEEGFEIFSAGTRHLKTNKQFIEIPAQVSFTRYDQGQKEIQKAKDVISMLVKGLYRRSLSGVLTHHDDFKTQASQAELRKFFNYIKLLSGSRKSQILLFSDLRRP